MTISAQAKESRNKIFTNIGFGYIDDTLLTSIELENNFRVINNLDLNIGISGLHSSGDFKYENDNNFINYSYFVGFKYRFLSVYKKKFVKKITNQKNNQLEIIKIYKNRYFNNNNGLYFGMNFHKNNFYNSDSGDSVEYNIAYEPQKMLGSYRYRFGYKYNNINNDEIEFNLHQLFIGVSFD